MYEELDKIKEALDKHGAEPLDLDKSEHMMAWANYLKVYYHLLWDKKELNKSLKPWRRRMILKAELKEVVERLQKFDPWAFSYKNFPQCNSWYCVFCGEYLRNTPDDHHPNCLWQKAQKLRTEGGG